MTVTLLITERRNQDKLFRISLLGFLAYCMYRIIRVWEISVSLELGRPIVGEGSGPEFMILFRLEI